MNAYLALALVLAAPAFALPATRDRAGYEREIDATRYYQVPKPLDNVLDLSLQKSRAKLVTKLRPPEAVAADNVILESNMVKIVRPAKKRENPEEGELVRTRRGYNLENVIVPARYPYLPVVRYNRFRRWG